MRERSQELWMLAASPSIWAAHFLLSYATASIWCVKLANAEASIAPVRVAIAGYTVIALVTIGIVGYIGFRRHRHERAALPHDADSPEDATASLALPPCSCRA